MSNRNRRLAWRRSAGEVDESGFTLIELLIVIVVLGILAAIVVFALGGVTGKSVISACTADAKTVDVGVVAAVAENPGLAPTGATWPTADLTTNTLTGGPFIQTWPIDNSQYYTISVAGGAATATTGDSTTPNNGDVIVTMGAKAAANVGKTYDYTQNGASACANA